MEDWLSLIHRERPLAARRALGAGDEIRVWFRIREQGKERLGQFEGTVIRCRGAGPSTTVTVRRVTHGEGVERIFPLDAPVIARIEVLRKGAVKRSRLYFLRAAVGKTRLSTTEAPPGGTTTEDTPTPAAQQPSPPGARRQPPETAASDSPERPDPPVADRAASRA
jgi:large subunit ribosomal protein L19